MEDWIKDKLQVGLYKRMRPTGDVWAVKGRIKGGKPITITIGKTSLFTVNQARVEARRYLGELAKGIDPNEQLKKKRIAEKARDLKLLDAIEKYQSLASWKEKTKKDALETLSRRFGDWFNKPLASITKEDCQSRFLKIKNDVKKIKTARDQRRLKQGLPVASYKNEIGLGEAQRAFRYLSAVFASFIHDDAGDEKLLPNGNPCLIIKAKKLRTTLKPRERYLSQSERDAIYGIFAATSHPDYPGHIQQDDIDLVWLLIHTGLRLDEARTLKWNDVDFVNEVFTARDTKNGRDHTLPFTSVTHHLFTSRLASKRSKIYVFPSPLNPSKPTSASRVFERVCAETGVTFAAHDLRRTVATLAGEIGYDLDSVGKLLNHAKKGVTGGYVQSTLRRQKEILEAIEAELFSDVKNQAM